MNIQSSVNWHTHKYYRKLLCHWIRKRIKPTTSIICNNCLGGRISQDLRYPYNSPTIGLFFNYPDYVDFLENLKECVTTPIMFRKTSKYLPQVNYPIGYFNIDGKDIQVDFLHYATEKEAREKWERRCKRVNWGDIVFIGSEQDGCNEQDIDRFVNIRKWGGESCLLPQRVIRS